MNKNEQASVSGEQSLREAAALAFETLHYICQTSDEEHVVSAAKEARDKLDVALSWWFQSSLGEQAGED